MRTDKTGQDMVEFIVGVFALVLIVSALIIFGRAIPEATRHLSLVRVKAGRDAQSAAGGDTLGGAPPAVMAALAEAAPGSHIHYDAYNSLESGSAELIVERIRQDRSGTGGSGEG